MAAVSVILGGAMGFLSALVALVVFNASWLFALGLWSLGGAGVSVILLALALLPRHKPDALVAELA